MVPRSALSLLLLLPIFTAAADSPCVASAPASPTASVSVGMVSTAAPVAFSQGKQQSVVPGPLWGTFTPPLPTNAWWMNLVLGLGDQPVAPYPYMVRATTLGLDISYATAAVSATSVVYPFVPDFSMGFSANASRSLAQYDSLVATMRWQPTPQSSMDAYIVRGQPYQTVLYRSVAPVLSTVHAILSINGVSVAAPALVTGNRFVLGLNNGQTWAVYSSAALTLSLVTTSSLVAAAPFSGVVRAAVVTSPKAQLMLDTYRAVYTTNAVVTQMVVGHTAELAFQFSTKKMTTSGRGGLLTCILPHHVNARATGKVLLKSAFITIRGPMRCISAPPLSSTAYAFQTREPLATLQWDAPRAIDADKVAAVQAALVADQGKVPVATDPYFFGKQVAAMGRLALIADTLGESDIAAGIRGRMKVALAPWLNGTNPDSLQYDPVWGGICSSAGLADGGADFGNGQYNDHHFHYGYFTYAAAVVGRSDAAWLRANEEALDELLRDFANPNAGDSFFTFARHKDWFEGHSWAAGVVAFGDGRNQESSSEAVNAYYAVYLLGLARKDPALADWGRVLLATEVSAAARYYHIASTDVPQIYPPPYAANKVVGVLWSGKADYSTWFGANVEFIHCIQILPVTPVTELLLAPRWVVEQYPVLAPALATATDAWKGFIYADLAVIDKVAAWAAVQTVASYDDGNSQTNTLYWMATRP